MILPLLMLAGTVVSLLGSAFKAKAENDAAQANAAEMARAAGMEDSNAVDALKQGAMLAGAQRMKGSHVVGQQKVAFAASGVDSTVGTPGQLEGTTTFWAEKDAQAEMNNAWRSALGHRETARRYRAGETQAKAAATDNLVATGIGMGSTMLGAATNAYSTFKG